MSFRGLVIHDENPKLGSKKTEVLGTKISDMMKFTGELQSVPVCGPYPTQPKTNGVTDR